MTIKVLSRWRPEFAKPQQSETPHGGQPQKQSSTPAPAPSNPNISGANVSNGIGQASAAGPSDMQHQQQNEAMSNTVPAAVAAD